MKIQMKKNENNMEINHFDDFQSVAAKNSHKSQDELVFQCLKMLETYDIRIKYFV